jgi:alpha-tubulin suppressor-like RCC1 family protein
MENSENEDDVPQIYLLGKTYLKSNEEFYIRNDSIIHMAAGDRHTIVITESGRAYAFGDNNSGKEIQKKKERIYFVYLKY